MVDAPVLTPVSPRVGRTEVTVAIVPNPGMSPADYQRLAYRLSVALKELPAIEDCTGNTSAIDDLVAGEFPKPIVMRAMAMYRELKRIFKERYVPLPVSEVTAAAKTALADHPLADLTDVPAVFVKLAHISDETDTELRDRIAALLPAELIREIRPLGR